MKTRAKPRQEGVAEPRAGHASLRGRELQQRRGAILSAVRGLIRKGGAKAVTMRAVADAVGASTTLVYSLFPDKASLISHALERDFKQLSQRLLAAAGPSGSAADRLRRVACAYAQHGLAHPLQYRLLFMEPRPLTTIERSGIEYGNLSEDAYALVCGLVTAMAAEQGLDLPRQEIQTVAQIVWEGVHGMVALRLNMEDDPWFERRPVPEHTDILVDVLMQGIAVRWKGFEKPPARP